MSSLSSTASRLSCRRNSLRRVFAVCSTPIINWAYDEAQAAVASCANAVTRERSETLVDALIHTQQLDVELDLRRRVGAAVFELARRMSDLALANRNGIWAFVLRNTYRPGLLAGSFNGLVSNPPWLAMSQLAENPYKTQLSARAAQYDIAPGGASHLHLELATTFLLHAIDRYLCPNAAVCLPLARHRVQRQSPTEVSATRHTCSPRARSRSNCRKSGRYQRGRSRSDLQPLSV